MSYEYEIGGRMLTTLTERDAGFVEGYAKACDDLMRELTGESYSAKSYDPMWIDLSAATMHSYAFDLKDGGRHHPLADYESVDEICALVGKEALTEIARHYAEGSKCALDRQDHGEHGPQAEDAAQTRAAEDATSPEPWESLGLADDPSVDAPSVEGTAEANESEGLFLGLCPFPAMYDEGRCCGDGSCTTMLPAASPLWRPHER